MNKIILIIIVILTVIFAGLSYFYYTNKNISPTLPPNTQDTGTQQPEKMPFDANDNLDEAIQELNQIE